MKKSRTLILSAGIVVLLATAIWFRDRHPVPAETSPATTTTPTAKGGTLDVSQNAKEIFRRAFWRQPTDSDRILHAERREWADSEKDVQRWQWFLEVEPSAGLMHDLREENRFSLTVTTSPQAWTSEESAPNWFPTTAQIADFEILQNPNGRLTILRHRQKNLIFATDQGQGFAAPVRPVSR